jgi:HPt (histidine-containing phosphotransfer) domain-containing protein
MTKEKPGAIEIKTFATHHVITQPNPLRNVLRRVPDCDLDDPVARAEQALAGLSGEFKNWMTIEADRLSAAHAAVLRHGFTKETREELFRAAHDIKGEAATFGYPRAGEVADSLCRLIEHSPDLDRLPIAMVDQHVDAVRAIIREARLENADETAARLVMGLRQVADEFLAHENRHRPDYLDGILSPPLAPSEAN